MSVGGNRSPYRAPCGYSAAPMIPSVTGSAVRGSITAARKPASSGSRTPPPSPITTPRSAAASRPISCPIPNTKALPLAAARTNRLAGRPLRPSSIPTRPYSPAEYIDSAACRKLGYKIVFARKYWQGRFGFGDGDNCNACPRGGSPSSTKYRTMSWDFTATVDYGGDPDRVETLDQQRLVLWPESLLREKSPGTLNQKWENHLPRHAN